MTRKKWLWAGVLVLMTAVFGVLICRADRLFYADAHTGTLGTLTRVDDAEIAERIAGRRETGMYLGGDPQQYEDNHCRVYADGMLAAYDAGTGTVYISESMRTVGWETALSSGEGELLIVDDPLLDDKAGAIASGRAFRVYWVSDTEYHAMNLVASGMPVMSFRAMRAQETDEGREYGATLWDTRFTGETREFPVALRRRGNTSRYYPKGSYRMKLDGRTQSLLGLKDSKVYVLNGLYDDAALRHNKVGYDLWTDIESTNGDGRDSGVRGEYVEVVLDNEFVGTYLMTEKPGKRTLSLGTDDTLLMPFTWIGEEALAARLEGVDLHSFMEQEYPDREDPELWEFMRECFRKLLIDSPGTFEELTETLNLENAIDYHCFILAIEAGDNEFKNTRFVCERNADGTLLHEIPWDLNFSFGHTYSSDPAGIHGGLLYREENITKVINGNHMLFNLTEQYPARMSELILTRWQELRKTVLSEEHIVGMLESELAYLEGSGAYRRNYEKWTECAEEIDPQNDVHFIRERLPYMDACLLKAYDESH